MSTTFVAYTDQLALPESSYEVDIFSVATDELITTLTAPEQADAFAVARLTANTLNPTINATSIRIQPGVSGCAGPVRIMAFRDEGSSPQQNQSASLLADFVYSGTGTMTVPLDRAAAVRGDRGYDYYVTLVFSNGRDLTLTGIPGLSRERFLATGSPQVFIVPGRSNGEVFTDPAGWTDQWPTVRFSDGRREITFGVNEEDIAGLSGLAVRYRYPPGADPQIPLTTRVLVAGGFRGAAFVAASITAPVEQYDAVNDAFTYPIVIDWDKVRGVFPVGAGPVTRRNNQLLKEVAVIRNSPGSWGIPANPGQPALPARFINVPRVVCSLRPDFDSMRRQGWTYTPPRPGETYTSVLQGWLPPGIQPPVTTVPGQYAIIGTGNQIGIGAQIPYIQTCSTVVDKVFVPAQAYRAPTPGVPPSPAQAILDFRIGWTGRARSIKFIPGGGVMSFRAPRSITGAVAGLNSQFRPSGYTDIRFAFRLENGVASAISPGGTTPLGAYTDNTRFSITRFNGRVVYRMDDTVVLDVPNNPEPLHFDAIMYTGGDSIFDPELSGLTAAEVTLRPLAGLGGGMQFTPAAPPAPVTASASLQYLTASGWGTRRQGAVSAAVLQPFTAASRAAVIGAGALAGFTAMGSDRPYAASQAALLPLTAEGEGGLAAPSYSVANNILGILTGGGNMLTGEIASGAGTLLAMNGLGSDRPYAAVSGALQPLTAVGRVLNELEAQEISMMEFVLAGANVEGAGELSVVMNSSGEVVGLMTISAAVAAMLESSGTATSISALGALLSANAVTAVSASSIEAFRTEGNSVWAVNVENDASVRYEDYGFNSFAKIDGRYYGAREDGIYLLEGDTDDGAPIQAMVAFGKKNFGDNTQTQLMRLENCYMGVASSGKLVLKIVANGVEHVYTTRSSASSLATQRVDIGRGIRANFMDFELWNQDGDDFDLRTIEFTAVVLKRRI